MASLLNTPVKRDVDHVLLGTDIPAWTDPCEAGYHLIHPLAVGEYICVNCNKEFHDGRAGS